MKLEKENLYNAITDIDDRFIEEADGYIFKKKFNIIKLSRTLGAVAAVLIVGFVGYNTFFYNPNKTAATETANDMAFSSLMMVGDATDGFDTDVYEDKAYSEIEESAPLVTESTVEEVDGIGGILYESRIPEAVQRPSDELIFEDSENYNKEFKKWSDSKIDRDAYKTVLNSDTDGFSGKLLNAVFTESGNTIVSPINVYLALGMLAEVTEGNSREQILNALNETSIENLRTTANSLWLYNHVDDGCLTSNLAASIWLSDKYNYKSASLKNLADNYFADSFSGTMGSDEYNEQFRSWINKNTGNLLQNQVSDMRFKKDTNAAITTTIYFKSSWLDEFSKYATIKDTFKGVNGDEEVDFMHKSEKGRYYVGKNFSAASISMQEGYSMLFLLPDEGQTPNDLMQDEEALKFILSSENEPTSSKATINFSVPKFDVDSQLELVDIIADMGVTDVVDCSVSDFTNLTEDTDEIFVSSILHGARVKIDEEGCEAAAYTVIMMTNTTAISQETYVDFILDRPFIFVIRNDAGMPLFVGTVYTIQK